MVHVDGAWRGRRAAAGGHKFPTYSPWAATLDFVSYGGAMAANCALGTKSAFYDCLVPNLSMRFPIKS